MKNIIRKYLRESIVDSSDNDEKSIHIQKVAQLSVKIGTKYKNNNPQFFYTLSTKEKFIKTFFNHLSGNDLVYFCFMSSAISLGMKPQELYEFYLNLQNNIFTFAIVEVTNDESTETCYDCGGDGEVYCGNCEGTALVNCPSCDGEGEIDDIPCDECDGEGSIRCDECSSGYVNCDTCYGTGETTKDGYVDITVSEFISYDSEIFNILEIKDDEVEITDDFVNKIYKSELTFMSETYATNTNSLESEAKSGMYYFSSMETTPSFRRGSDGTIKTNLMSWG